MSVEINSEYDIYENFKQGNKFDFFDKKSSPKYFGDGNIIIYYFHIFLVLLQK